MVAEVAAAAAAMGAPVRVYAPMKDSSKSQPYDVVEIPNRGTLGWGCRLRTLRLLRRNCSAWRDSIVHLAEPGPILACMYGQLAGILPRPQRLILTLHGSEILRFARLPHTSYLFQRLLRHVDAVHFLSQACKHLFLRHFNKADDALHVVPGAARRFPASTQETRSFSNQTGKTIYLTVGRVHPRKGQLACIEAMGKLPAEIRSTLEYWVAGPVVDRGYQRDLETNAQASGLDVKFLGEIQDAEMEALYEAADLFIMTSVPHRRSIEGFGLVYLEAATHGLPIIAHRIGGVSEAMREGETARLCDPANRDALATAIWDLLQDKEMRHRMGQAGKAFAAQFSWENTARALYV